MLTALTIYQPWAGFIAAGMKRIETRSWPTAYRGEIAIHAGMHPMFCDTDDLALALLEMRTKSKDLAAYEKLLARGAVVAAAMLVDCVRTEDVAVDLGETELLLGNYSRGRWAWLLGNVIALDHPVHCRGQQGLWTLPPEVEAAVRAELWQEAK